MISSQLYRNPLQDVANNILGYSVGLVGIPIRDILRSRRGVLVSVSADRPPLVVIVVIVAVVIDDTNTPFITDSNQARGAEIYTRKHSHKLQTRT